MAAGGRGYAPAENVPFNQEICRATVGDTAAAAPGRELRERLALVLLHRRPGNASSAWAKPGRWRHSGENLDPCGGR